MEAYYRDIPDLLGVPARKLLNLTLHWMMEHTDSDVWDKELRPKFFPTEDDPDPSQEKRAKLADAKPGQQGSLNIKPKANPVAVTDLSQFLGRAGSAGKSDPNKAALRAKASKPEQDASISIRPDAEGNLKVDRPE